MHDHYLIELFECYGQITVRIADFMSYYSRESRSIKGRLKVKWIMCVFSCNVDFQLLCSNKESEWKSEMLYLMRNLVSQLVGR